MKNVLVFGGTSEEHALIDALYALPLKITLSLASVYGLAMLPQQNKRLHIRHGVMDAQQMAELMRAEDFCCVIDATHPYAVLASANIRAAAATVELPYLRLLREASNLNGCLTVDSATQAVVELDRLNGAVLLTSGSKDLAVFSEMRDYQSRLYVRVLPRMESLTACAQLGLPLSHIIAMQGPYSVQLNVALIREFDIKTLVTKDGGAAGGLLEKLAAARELAVNVIVIRRPAETGLMFAELMQKVEELR